MNDFARKLSDLIDSLYSKKKLNELARKTKFTQRSDAKLRGFDFLLAMTLGSLSSTSKSLSSLVSSILHVVSRTSFHDRINKNAADFMRQVLEDTLRRQQENRTSLSSGAFRKFSRILIWDSSSWGVNEKLSSVFKGKGGSGSGAGVFLQYAFDLKSSVIEFFDIASGTTNDQHYRTQIEGAIRKRDLLLFDRGYFNIDLFKAICAKAAYYICRFKLGTTLYIRNNGSYKKLDILKLLRRNRDSNLIDFEVALAREKIPSRIVCIRLPDAVANKKIRKMRKEAKERGKEVSNSRLLLARWCVFISNAPYEKLNAVQLTEFYRLRWSVELIFKQLKSTFGIDKTNHSNQYRLLCEMYGVLIMAALTQQIHGTSQYLTWKSYNCEVSIEKTFKFIRQFASRLLEAILERKLITLLNSLANQVLSLCLKNKQPSRKSAIERAMVPIYQMNVLTLANNQLLTYA